MEEEAEEGASVQIPPSRKEEPREEREEEEEEEYRCGRCPLRFGSLAAFMDHRNYGCVAGRKLFRVLVISVRSLSANFQ